jgi:hypothetical protein
MVQHILPKGFQRIRSYGLQASCTLKKVRAQLLRLLHLAEQQVLPLTTQRPSADQAIASGCTRRLGTIRWSVRAVAAICGSGRSGIRSMAWSTMS